MPQINELHQYLSQSITLHGWVHTIRNQKHMQFLILCDRSGMVQVVLEKASNPALAERVETLTRESAVTLTGTVNENPGVKLGGIEIYLTEMIVESLAASPLPLDPTGERPGPEHRLDWRHLDLRRPENMLLFQVQTTAEMAMREFWYREGFIEIHTPKLMGSASESGAELFELPYFDTTAYLAQSPQFYKQMAISSGFDRVFEIAPVFRADPSFTSRHTTEFTSMDVEIAWIESHEDVMACEEQWLRHILEVVQARHGEEIRKQFGVEIIVPECPFPRITMAEALEQLAAVGYEAPPEKVGDLDPQGERLLGEWVQQKYGHEFVFLTDCPISVRPFYHMRFEETPHLTKSFDLLWKGLEITTGAQREHRLDRLQAQAQEKKLNLETLNFYLSFFRYGCPPHGGYGFGLARMLMVMLGLDNLRETTLLPRTPNRLHP